MSTDDPLERAIQLIGLTKLAAELKVTHQAVRKWQRASRMPRTEWTRETVYSDRIEALTAGRVTRDQLLNKWAVSAAGPADSGVSP